MMENSRNRHALLCDKSGTKPSIKKYHALSNHTTAQLVSGRFVLSRNMSTRVCKGGEGSCSLTSRRVWRMMVKHGTRAQRFPKRRANTAYSDEGERGNPPLTHNFKGWSRKASAFPSVVANADGGLVVQAHVRNTRFVDEGGDEAAHAGNADVVLCMCMRQTRTST
jgi:hypothetical protein